MLVNLLKLPLKILALPLIVICTVTTWLVRTAANLSSYVLGPLMLFILGCGVYTVFKQLWSQTLLLALMEAAGVAVLFGAVIVETALTSMSGTLMNFVKG